MGSSDEKVVDVIMVRWPTKRTRFRPLSLNIPKPLLDGLEKRGISSIFPIQRAILGALGHHPCHRNWHQPSQESRCYHHLQQAACLG
ncbi:hypothetical protein ACFXTH_040862 [Malus domestica]